MATDERKALQARLDLLERENASLKEMVARQSPEALASSAPAPVASYSDDLPGKVIALGMIGKTPIQIRAASGIREHHWHEWRDKYPSFKDAADYARDAGRAFWIDKMSRATSDKDWKFPLEKALKMVESLFGEDEIDRLGDASQFVRVEPGCPHCKHCRGDRAEPY